MKKLAFILLLFVFAPALLPAAEIEPTIYRSESDEKRFRTFSEDKVEVLAVCPKKGHYFVEILADESEIEEFKKRIKASDLKVTKITDWVPNTPIGSRVIMVEFKY